MTRTSTFVVVMIGAIIGFALDGDLAENISDIAAYALGAGTVLSTHYWKANDPRPLARHLGLDRTRERN